MIWFLPVLLLGLPWVLKPRASKSPEMSGVLDALWWVNRIYTGFWHRLEASGAESIPDEGPAILISNHTCGIDHSLLQAGCRRVLGFMIAQEYYDHPVIGPLCRLAGCIPVKRDGRDLSATRAALRSLKEGRIVPIFPEGKIIPTSGRVIGEAKPGAAYIALRSKAPVIPAYIRGTPETNDIARSILTPSEAVVVFGSRVDLSDLFGGNGDERAGIDEATGRMMDAIRQLRDQAVQNGD